MKTAIITGITGQDGSYLAELLLSKNYRVIGCHRRNSTNNYTRIKHILSNPQITLQEFDLLDPISCARLLQTYQPDELYNLAAQSHVATSFRQPINTFNTNTIGVNNLLESIRLYSPHTRMYQASTSEMFGRNYKVIDNNRFQDETVEFLPQSPYGVSKVAAHQLISVYKLAYNIYACSGILFNHESPRRGENFVTKKITTYIGQYKNGLTKDKLKLGNLSAKRDWGHARDYVLAMWMMLQMATPEDYVICSGHTRSVRDFVEFSFNHAGLDHSKLIEIDPELFRPSEVDYLKGSFAKAQQHLGWAPTTSFQQLVTEMVDYDYERFQRSSVH